MKNIIFSVLFFGASYLLWLAANSIDNSFTQFSLLLPGDKINPYRELNWISLIPFLLSSVSLASSLICIAKSLANFEYLQVSVTQNSQILDGIWPTVSLGIVVIFFYSTDLFLNISAEDGLFENLQFIFYLSAGMILLFSGFRYLSINRPKGIILIISSLLILFVAGEEISWGQRILNIDTPELFENNAQNEMNIHNFKGGLFNTIQLFMAFTLWGLMSAIAFLSYRPVKGMLLYLPNKSSFIAYSAGIGLHPGYGHEVGLIFAFTCMAVCLYALLNKIRIYIAAYLLVILNLTLYFCFFHDHRLGELWWHIDECREFFYAAAVLLYVLHVKKVAESEASL